jgi:hypothetical protein
MTPPASAAPDPLRAAARSACQARGLNGRPVWDCLPYLVEDVGRLVNAVRRDDLAAVRAEIAACAAVLDHVAELYDGRELSELVSERAAAGYREPATAAATW